LYDTLSCFDLDIILTCDGLTDGYSYTVVAGNAGRGGRRVLNIIAVIFAELYKYD